MSLSATVKEIAEDMEKEAQATPERSSDPRLLMYAKQLLIAVKASGESSSGGVILGAKEALRSINNFVDENTRKVMQKKAELVREEANLSSIREEKGSPSLTYTVGGSLDGDTMIPIDPSMPVGAKTMIGREVYVLKEDRKLHYSKEETEKLFRKN